MLLNLFLQSHDIITVLKCRLQLNTSVNHKYYIFLGYNDRIINKVAKYFYEESPLPYSEHWGSSERRQLDRSSTEEESHL